MFVSSGVTVLPRASRWVSMTWYNNFFCSASSACSRSALVFVRDDRASVSDRGEPSLGLLGPAAVGAVTSVSAAS